MRNWAAPLSFVSNPEQTASPTATAGGEMDVEREVRFAVVMYGGVSLAIYINGVTQELLSLVRATARKPGTNEMLLSEDELRPSEAVYRDLAKHLDRISVRKNKDSQGNDVTRTQFVVDIISGTSAGGINGVFLAKALARNQTMGGLKRLWLAEGDLGKLLNDTRAKDYSREAGFPVQTPEASLLNSHRMYRKLLEALEEMGDTANPAKASALVNELDLFVTTTDIEGIPLPIQLSDRVVYERRYRNVFHFRYARDPRLGEQRESVQDFTRDDFTKENDPFLAFAARCTSSFPFAFDAMQLADIKIILDRYRHYADDDPTESDQPGMRTRWDEFFKEYLRLGLFDIDKKSRCEQPTGAPDDALSKLRDAFWTRSFGDGGYLDNKPFSYATSMLMRRQANCVVDRKLLYVEPTPEHPELTPKKTPARPDFARNVRAAALDLPRRETIREDLDYLYDRNRMLERIGTFAQHVDEDVILLTTETETLNHDEFREADLRTMINTYGVNYGAYHRLKVAEITTLITDILARALGHDPGSDATLAIRELVAAWRRDEYDPLHQRELASAGNKKKTENQFLLEFDTHYSLRRLNFLNRRINLLAQDPGSAFDAKSKKMLCAWLEHLEKTPLEKNQDLLRTVKQLRGQIESNDPKTNLPLEWLPAFRAELIKIKRHKIAPALIAARLIEEIFLRKDSDPARCLREAAADFGFSWESMQQILSQKDEQKRNDLAEQEFNKRASKLRTLIDVIKTVLSKREGAQLTIANSNDVDLNKGDVAARVFLDYYYRNFVLYDLITYPVEYGTGAGEANVVKVYRVSPEDASAIMEEHAGKPRDKLAGRTLMSFGAFLDESWRKNDMIWGRLDGAERLIAVLLEDEQEQQIRDNFVERAHREILLEEIKEGNGDAVCRLLSNALAHRDLSNPKGQRLQNFVKKLLQQPDLSKSMVESLSRCLDAPEKFARDLPPQRALEYISRSTNITGNMLSALADKYRIDPAKRFASWMARLGAVLWNLIAVAVPENLASLFFRHWLRLLYFFAVALIVVGLLNPTMKFEGWEVLGIIVAVHLIVFGLRSYIRGKLPTHVVSAALRAAVAFIISVLIVTGILHLIERWFHTSSNQLIELSIAGCVALGVGIFVLNQRGREESQRLAKKTPAQTEPSANQE